MSPRTVAAARLLVTTAGLALGAGAAHGQGQFVNRGLVGVGRIPAASFDLRGASIDTLGGVFSAMALDPASVQVSGGTYTGVLYGLPDRGFGDGTTDYLARRQTFGFAFTPYYGQGPAPQNQIVMTNTATLLLSYAGRGGNINFTGFDPDDTSVTTFPQSAAAGVGGGKRSLDAEGIALAPGGAFYVSDEYGPMVCRFSSSGELQETILPGAAILPKRGASYPRPNSFAAATAPDCGRRNNRGLEGVTITPDGRKLVSVLQSPTIQDGGASNPSRNTRILVWDIDPASPTNGQQVGEYVYQLTTNGNAAGTRHTPISEILAFTDTKFLVLERDGVGLGSTTTGPIVYKKVNLLDLSGATNLIGTPYALELGAPGQLNLPTGALPAGIIPAARLDFVDLLDVTQLAKFGLNLNQFGAQDQNTVCEKWEGLALIPAGDPSFPDDFFLLVGNDNDFKAPQVVHNGVVVGSNAVTVDSMVLAYRIALPADGLIRPCYANCDGSTIAPVLNVNDFICFQTKFAAGDSYANCDNSTTAPVLNVNDFQCFLNQFASGCP